METDSWGHSTNARKKEGDFKIMRRDRRSLKLLRRDEALQWSKKRETISAHILTLSPSFCGVTLIDVGFVSNNL